MTSGSATRRLLGVDPGLNTTGYGVIEVGTGSGSIPLPGKIRLIEAGIIRSKPKESIEARLREIHSGLREVRRVLSLSSMHHFLYRSFGHISVFINSKN